MLNEHVISRVRGQLDAGQPVFVLELLNFIEN